MVLYTTVVIRGLCLWYNSSNIRYIFYNKPFKVERQMFKDKPTPLLAIHCVKSVQIRRFFWPVFSRIRTEYGEILRIFPYSVRMRENKNQKKLRIWILFTQWIKMWNFYTTLMQRLVIFFAHILHIFFSEVYSLQV